MQVGDFVVLNWRAVCGQCRACKRGRPQYCFDTFNAAQKMTLEDGTELTPALGIGAFADKTLVHAGQCTKVDPAADPAVVGFAGLWCHGGFGRRGEHRQCRAGRLRRGHRVRWCRRRRHHGCPPGRARQRSSRSTATRGSCDGPRELGATHTVNAAQVDTVEAVQELTGGFGADVVIDAVGRPETWRQAFYARDLAGTVVLVGVPTPDMTLEMPLVDFFSRGGALKSSWYGDCLPERDFPTLVDLYQQGRLPLEKFVSERIKLDDVEEAFHTMHAGEVLRSVVVL